MKIALLTPASASEKWADLATELYLEKLGHFFKTEIIFLKPKKAARGDSSFKKESESADILAALTPDDYVILFDERGKTLDSRAYAKTLQGGFNSGKKRLVFIIGGAFGVSEQVSKRANQCIRLSDMVMNHLLARVVVLEQTYRALTIINNLPYHND